MRPDIAEQILIAKSPHAVKEISDAHKPHQPASWRDMKVAIMTRILQEKFEQHTDVKEILRKTGNREIWMKIRDAG